MDHKLLILNQKLCVTELKLMTHSHFIEMLTILTKYAFDISVRLTEYSATAGSVTLRFYCIYILCVCVHVYKKSGNLVD